MRAWGVWRACVACEHGVRTWRAYVPCCVHACVWRGEWLAGVRGGRGMRVCFIRIFNFKPAFIFESACTTHFMQIPTHTMHDTLTCPPCERAHTYLHSRTQTHAENLFSRTLYISREYGDYKYLKIQEMTDQYLLLSLTSTPLQSSNPHA